MPDTRVGAVVFALVFSILVGPVSSGQKSPNFGNKYIPLRLVELIHNLVARG